MLNCSKGRRVVLCVGGGKGEGSMCYNIIPFNAGICLALPEINSLLDIVGNYRDSGRNLDCRCFPSLSLLPLIFRIDFPKPQICGIGLEAHTRVSEELVGRRDPAPYQYFKGSLPHICHASTRDPKPRIDIDTIGI
jgi:hypothetical protein